MCLLDNKEQKRMKTPKKESLPTDEPRRIVTVRVPLSVFRLLKHITSDTDESNAQAVAAAIKLYAQAVAAQGAE